MKIQCEVSYDGTLFHGFVSQKSLRTVQKEIEQVLEFIYKDKVRIYASSRTDAGVHALGQVFHYDAPLDIPLKNLLNAINSRLPKDIYINHIKEAHATFNARFDALGKIYHYKLHLNEYLPLLRNYVHFYYKRPKLDLNKMMEASKHLIGTHDFKSFAKVSDKEDTVRTITKIDFLIDQNDVVIVFEGNGFLHNMVRIIVGMLLEVGRNKVTPEQLKEILAQKNRIYAPKIAPSCGLYLMKIFYEK